MGMEASHSVESAGPAPAPRALPHRRRLNELRDEFVRRASHQRWSDAESREWAQLEHGLRMSLLLLAGVDGELAELSHRDWRELPEAERTAIKREARAARRGFEALHALTGLW
jgi:hypothetical protein